MKQALERTIQTLIDSGGDPWEYDSKDIELLVQWIEERLKNLNGETVKRENECDSPLSHLSYKKYKDKYRYCPYCGVSIHE